MRTCCSTVGMQYCIHAGGSTWFQAEDIYCILQICTVFEHQKYTVKASNLGHHGNLGPLFRRACYHENASYRKMKRLQVIEKFQIYIVGSVHFWYKIHPKKLRNLQKRSKVSMWSKVKGFYGISWMLACARPWELSGTSFPTRRPWTGCIVRLVSV